LAPTSPCQPREHVHKRREARPGEQHGAFRGQSGAPVMTGSCIVSRSYPVRGNLLPPRAERGQWEIQSEVW
jgi:hypothetical protein